MDSNSSQVVRSKMSVKERASLIREMRKKVLTLVESMLEANIEEKDFLDACQSLTRGNLEDINVERSLIPICGYPLCTKPLPSQLQQKYKISLKTHKVYDITERKLFCSDLCYTASCYVKEQLPEEPWWMIQSKSAAPQCSKKLVSLYKETKGAPGSEISIKVALETNEDESKKELVPASEAKSDAKKPPSLSSGASSLRNQAKQLGYPYIKKGDLERIKDSVAALKIAETECKVQKEDATVEREEKVDNKKTSLTKSAKETAKASQRDPKDYCFKILGEWFTDATRCFILDENELEEKKTAELSVKKQMDMFSNYQKICRRLDIEEEMDKIEDEILLGRRQLDDVMEEKENAKGEPELDQKKLESLAIQAIESYQRMAVVQIGQTCPSSVLKIRQQFVLNKINNVLNHLCGDTKANQLSDYFFQVLKTMNLTASNVILKASEWSLMTVLLLKLLCYKHSWKGITVIKSIYNSNVVQLVENKFFSTELTPSLERLLKLK